MKKQNFLIYFILLCFFSLTYSWITNTTDDSVYMEKILSQQKIPDNGSLFYLIGKIGYFLFLNKFFVLFTIFCLLISCHFLINLFQEFSLNKFLILPLFYQQSWEFLFTFHRELLLFAFASIFAFYFFLTIFKEKNYVPILFILGFLMTFTKTIGIIYIFIAYLTLIIKYKKYALLSLFIHIESGLKNLLPINFLQLYNPFSFIALIVFPFFRSLWFLFFILLYFIVSNAIFNLGFNTMTVFRYTYHFSIFLWFFIILSIYNIWFKFSGKQGRANFAGVGERPLLPSCRYGYRVPCLALQKWQIRQAIGRTVNSGKANY